MYLVYHLPLVMLNLFQHLCEQLKIATLLRLAQSGLAGESGE